MSRRKLRENYFKILFCSYFHSDNELHEQIKLFMENEEKLAQMESLIDGMKFENMEAYFVIYAKDNIKFVIKSGDMIIGDQAKISFSQKVTAKNYEGIIKVQPIMTGEALTGEKQEISFVYTVKDAGKGKF